MKPTPKPGQEWERTHNDPSSPSSPPTRIRIVEWTVGERSGRVSSRGTVESHLGGGRWGRRRQLLLSALSNTPKGYRLVKEAP